MTVKCYVSDQCDGTLNVVFALQDALLRSLLHATQVASFALTETN